MNKTAKCNEKRCEAKHRNRRYSLHRFILSLESSIQKSRIITEINNADGIKITEKSEICNVFKNFYSELYKEEETDDNIQNSFLNFTRKLNEEEKLECGSQITVNELEKALLSMNVNATPGPNGLTVSFFKKFFNALKPIYERFLSLLQGKQFIIIF